MATPKFIESEPLCLTDVQAILQDAEQRDKELNYLSNKCKEFLMAFEPLPKEKCAALMKKLMGLQLTRLKQEHVCKIVDFLPITTNDLKIALQAYPLSMPKKDMDAIVEVVKEFMK